ncbi:RNase H1/viroplasmin domain-containing protein [Pseudomonas viridiflava]|nr:RNase H1/viroplasmin domain-containing protein [Pseudomonas viridiflava]
MAKKPKFYAVTRGRKLGIFNTWEDGARLSVERYPDAKHESFSTLGLAEEWYRQNSPTPGSVHSPVVHFRRIGAHQPGEIVFFVKSSMKIVDPGPDQITQLCLCETF